MSIEQLETQYDKIYRYCYFHVHDRELAEDITQETFLRFLEHPQYHAGEMALPYLYTIAKHLCIDEYRKQPTEALPEQLCSAENQEDIWILHISLQKAVAALPELEREMVLLRYVNEVPLGVLSEFYHMSRFSLHRKLKKILADLRKEFEKEEWT